MANTAAFYLRTTRSPIRILRPPALCLSRFTMDALLAAQFRENGGHLRENTRWRGSECSEGVVRASGRRLQSCQNNCRWFGLKAHAHNVVLESDMEMHSLDTGYVGLCRLGADEINVCGLFLKNVDQQSTMGTWQQMLTGPNDTALRARLQNAVFIEDSFCSVAGLSLKPQYASVQTAFRIGDSLTMIPPVTGNGMSMAFESAELAVLPLQSYSLGEMSWVDARQTFARACNSAFSRRLMWAKALQWLMLAPVIRNHVGTPTLRCQWLWLFLPAA